MLRPARAPAAGGAAPGRVSAAARSAGAASIYRATVTHRRNASAPGSVERTFRYRTYYWLVDVDALPHLPSPLRPFARFRASDHLGDPDASLGTNVRAALRPHGIDADRVLLLTCPRVGGHVFNPLSVFYCLARTPPPEASGGRTADAGEAVVAIVAEVHNTYGGRHVYVLRPDESGRDSVDKQFYVSPFLPMGGSYLMRTPVPDETLAVSIALRQDGRTPFVATLTGRGRPATTGAILRASLRWPFVTLRTAALIRWQGVRLWLRRVPVQPRPAGSHLDERSR